MSFVCWAFLVVAETGTINGLITRQHPKGSISRIRNFEVSNKRIEKN